MWVWMEKPEKETRTIQAYSELLDQDIVVISTRPFKKAQCRCPDSPDQRAGKDMIEMYAVKLSGRLPGLFNSFFVQRMVASSL